MRPFSPNFSPQMCYTSLARGIANGNAGAYLFTGLPVTSDPDGAQLGFITDIFQQRRINPRSNYSAIVVKKVQTNSKQKANANPIVDAVG